MRDIIVFGTGKYFEHKRAAIQSRYHITGFLDNRAAADAPYRYRDTDIPVMNPAAVDAEGTTEIFLMSVHFVGMWKQLCEAGVDPGRLVFPFEQKPFFENEEALAGCLERIVFQRDCFVCFCRDGRTIRIGDEDAWRAFLRQAYRERYAVIRAVAEMDTEPVSRQFGTERGTPVDRYYIARFLRQYRDRICGDVLEIEDNTYTRRFGAERVVRSLVMDVSNAGGGITFNGNLETGEGIRDGIADCFILTQTLMYLADVRAAAHNIGRLLKKGGSALITCSGLSQNSIRCMDDYGCRFNFNMDAFRWMFAEEPSLRLAAVGSFGNVKTVTAHIVGLCREDLQEKDFEANDKYYPLIVYAVVEKI